MQKVSCSRRPESIVRRYQNPSMLKAGRQNPQLLLRKPNQLSVIIWRTISPMRCKSLTTLRTLSNQKGIRDSWACLIAYWKMRVMRNHKAFKVSLLAITSYMPEQGSIIRRYKLTTTTSSQLKSTAKLNNQFTYQEFKSNSMNQLWIRTYKKISNWWKAIP